MQWEHCLSPSGPAERAFTARTQLCLSPPHPDIQDGCGVDAAPRPPTAHTDTGAVARDI